MTLNSKLNFYLLIGIFICSSINCDESIVDSQSNVNLLSNGSFEIDNKPSLEGWRFGNQHLAEIINQAAPDGGNWSLLLSSDWAPTGGFIYTPINNVKSGDIVKLTAYVRGTGQFGGQGIIELVQGQNIYSANSKSISSNDSVWTQISLTDTLTLTNNDTLFVMLSARITEIIPYQQLFDVVKLEKISN